MREKWSRKNRPINNKSRWPLEMLLRIEPIKLLRNKKLKTLFRFFRCLILMAMGRSQRIELILLHLSQSSCKCSALFLLRWRSLAWAWIKMSSLMLLRGYTILLHFLRKIYSQTEIIDQGQAPPGVQRKRDKKCLRKKISSNHNLTPTP